MILHGIQIDDYIRGYIECALWSTNDESRDDGGDPLDDNYSPEDISEETVRDMVADCNRFYNKNEKALRAVIGKAWKYHGRMYMPSDAGHDLWLSRNGHGAGFFDNSESRGDVWDQLQEAARKFGEFGLYVCEPGHGYKIAGG